MVNAETHCKCQTCGRTFVMRKSCPDEIAAGRFLLWTELNCDRCPSCYRKYMSKPSGKITHAIEEFLKVLRIIR